MLGKADDFLCDASRGIGLRECEDSPVQLVKALVIGDEGEGGRDELKGSLCIGDEYSGVLAYERHSVMGLMVLGYVRRGDEYGGFAEEAQFADGGSAGT